MFAKGRKKNTIDMSWFDKQSCDLTTGISKYIYVYEICMNINRDTRLYILILYILYVYMYVKKGFNNLCKHIMEVFLIFFIYFFQIQYTFNVDGVV